MKHSWTTVRILSPASVCALSLWGIAPAPSLHAAPVSGAAVYQKHCAACHDQVSSRAPQRDALRQMSAARILRTLDFGLMMTIAYPLHRDEREAVALDLKTGRILWSQQTLPGDVYNSDCGRRDSKGPNCPPESGPDYDFGASALLVPAAGGRDVLVAGQKSGMVYALDPDQKGKILWQARVGKGGINGGVQWGMASDEQKVYAAVSDAVRLQGGSSSSPGPIGLAVFDPAQGGGLTALRLEDGSKAWFAPAHPCDPPRAGCSPAQGAALTAIPGAVFSGSLDGHLRAFSTEDGQVLWDFDTAREYSTVNGMQANGGSLDGAGAVIVGGMVFVNSGYPRQGGMPGNVLLAFAPED